MCVLCVYQRLRCLRCCVNQGSLVCEKKELFLVPCFVRCKTRVGVKQAPSRPLTCCLSPYRWWEPRPRRKMGGGAGHGVRAEPRLESKATRPHNDVEGGQHNVRQAMEFGPNPDLKVRPPVPITMWGVVNTMCIRPWSSGRAPTAK